MILQRSAEHKLYLISYAEEGRNDTALHITQSQLKLWLQSQQEFNGVVDPSTTKLPAKMLPTALVSMG